MLFYIAWFMLVLLLLLFSGEDRNINIIIIFMLFILVYGCRNYGGVDDFVYIKGFNDALYGIEVYGIEKSFVLTARLLGGLGFNYKAIFFLYSLISFTFVYLSYNELCRNTEDWIITILGFFVFAFTPTITVMRQFAAAAIISYAYTLKIKDKNIIPLFFIAMACFIHLGAVIAFAIYPLLFIEIKKRDKIIAPIICMIIGYTGLLNRVLNKLVIIIPYKYLNYIDEVNSSDSNIGILHLLLIAIYLAQFILRPRSDEEETIYKENYHSSANNNLACVNTDSCCDNIRMTLDKQIYYLEVFQMIYFCFYFITLSSGWINRLSIYFILFLPFIFKTFASNFTEEKDRRVLSVVFLFAFILLYIYEIREMPDSIEMRALLPYDGSFHFLK